MAQANPDDPGNHMPLLPCPFSYHDSKLAKTGVGLAGQRQRLARQPAP